MPTKSSRLWLWLWPLSIAPAYSAAIQNLTFTDVVNEVVVINAATKREAKVKTGDILVPPNVLKTGPDSRAELIAEDKTVTRVGSNTIFSVEADTRDVNITQGSVLFQSPKGKGGGRIRCAGATASVLGTTLLVGANSAGGFKVMLLEGKGQVDGAKGGSIKLSPGQMSFALPGKAPTPPLNFELKASVGGSKLVGGFSKPLASIAKIEAAITAQQAKIANGALGNTGLIIGDRPDVAFRVDITSLQSVITEIVDQIATKTETETASRNKVDPRYAAALAKSQSLTSEVAPEDVIFTIDGSGVTKEGYKGPKTVPGYQQEGGSISALIGKNITLSLSALDATPPSPFLHSPVSEKDSSAIVALNDLTITSSIEFVAFDKVFLSTKTDANGEELSTASGTPLLLSAGHTINFNPGALVRADTSILDIYAAGTEFSADTELAAKLAEVKAPLVLDRVALINHWSSGISNFWNSEGTSKTNYGSDALDGLIRITAPSIQVTDSAVVAGKLELTADGQISIASRGVSGTVTTENGVSKITVLTAATAGTFVKNQQVVGEGIPTGTTIESISSDGTVLTLSSAATINGAVKFVCIPLGADASTDLAVQGYVVKMTSTNQSVSVTDANLYFNQAEFKAGTNITLKGVTAMPFAPSFDQTLTASAENDITVEDATMTAVIAATVATKSGKFTLKNSSIGVDPTEVLDSESVTESPSVLANAIVSAETVELQSDGDLTAYKSTLTGKTQTGSALTALSKRGNVSMKDSVVAHYAVRITAGGDVVDTSTARNSVTGLRTLTAGMDKKIALSNVSFTNAQAAANVALDAATIVLKDVSFAANSLVTLRSFHGLVAAEPGMNRAVQRGYVNFVSGNKYGAEEIKLPNATSSMNHAQFQAAAIAAGKDFSKITIGTQTGGK